MKVMDKAIKKKVEVRDSACLRRPCYWPRPDPGVFVQGRGYWSRGNGPPEWICGTRNIHGCPDPIPVVTPTKDNDIIT